MDTFLWIFLLGIASVLAFFLGYVAGRHAATRPVETPIVEAPVEVEPKVPSTVDRLGAGLPSFGKAELVTYQHEDYEGWLSCCAGGELLVPGQQVYIIPLTNSDGLLALCLNHREIPAKEKTP